MNADTLGRKFETFVFLVWFDFKPTGSWRQHILTDAAKENLGNIQSVALDCSDYKCRTVGPDPEPRECPWSADVFTPSVRSAAAGMVPISDIVGAGTGDGKLRPGLLGKGLQRHQESGESAPSSLTVSEVTPASSGIRKVVDSPPEKCRHHSVFQIPFDAPLRWPGSGGADELSCGPLR